MSQTTSFARPKYKVEVRKNLFNDNFADGVADTTEWIVDAGNWSVVQATQFDGDNGYVFQQSNVSADRISYVNAGNFWPDYYVVIAFKIITLGGAIGLLFRRTNASSNYYSFKITQGSSNNLKLEKEDGTQIGSLASAIINANIWYMARVRVSGSVIECDISIDFENFSNYISETDSSYPVGGIGIKTYQSQSQFDNIEVFELKKSITEATNKDLLSLAITQSNRTAADVFSLVSSNVSGTNFGVYQPGFEVHAWAGYEESNPMLRKIFLGIIEEPIPGLSKDGGDTIAVSGSEYMVEALSRKATEVYYNADVSDIVKDLIAKYARNITAGLNVQATNNIIPSIQFVHKPLLDCLKELSVLGDGTNPFDFWIDLKKDFHFKPYGTEDSGQTLIVGENIIEQNFGPTLLKMYNRVTVYAKGRPDADNAVQQSSENIDEAFGKSTSFQKIAQTFKLSKNEVFDVVIKPQANTGIPESNISVELQETDGSGLPTGSVLVSYEIILSDWNKAITNNQDITVSLDATIDTSKTYAIVLRTSDGTLDDSNHFNVASKNSDSYAGGKRLFFNGTVWADNSQNFDLYFKVFPRAQNVQIADDPTSQELYNNIVREKEIFDDSIRAVEGAKVRAEKELVPAPPYEGEFLTLGLEEVRAGQTITVTIPNSNINGVPYTIIELTHSISKDKGYTSSVVLNSRPEAAADILLDHEKRLKELEAKLQEQTTEFGKTLILNESVTLDNQPESFTVESRYLQDTFVWDDDENGRLYDPSEEFVIDDFETLGVWASGAGSISLTESADNTAGHFWTSLQGINYSWSVGSGTAIIEFTGAIPSMQNVVGVANGNPIRGTGGVHIFTQSPQTISNIKIRFESSPSDYLEYVATVYAGIPNLIIGYPTLVLADLDNPATSSGTINWAALTKISIKWAVSAPASITFDRLSVSKNDTICHTGWGDRSVLKSVNEVFGVSI